MAKSPTFTTPPGIAVYPRLKTPDTKFHDQGIYKADLSLTEEEAAPLVEQLQAIHKSHTGKPAKKSENTMWYVETDEEGEETGRIVFKIRVKNRTTKKGELWDRKPAMFDAGMKPIDENPWGGSVYSVFGEIYAWTAGDKKGVSLQPIGVQVIDLKSGGDGQDAASMGFKAQDGYSAPTTVAEAMSDDEGEPEAGGDADPDNGDY